MENEDENENIHGNSKESKKKQHLYEIVDSLNDDETMKYGISGSEINKNGTSQRANSQVNKWNLIEGFKRFFARILKMNIEGRNNALELEKQYIRQYKKQNNINTPPKRQLKPNPPLD